MTQAEIDSLIAFAREFDRRLTESRIKQKDLSAMTAKDSLKPISPGYISDILSVARGNSKKRFRLTREKVTRLAEVLDWPQGEALDLAGYKAESNEPSLKWSSDIFDRARIERMLRNYEALTVEEQEEIAPYLKAIETNVERRAHRRKKQ